MNIGQALASKGRFGDTMVAHISPQEAMLLKMRGGKGTRNPKTGLPEFWNDTDFLASFGTGEGGYDEYLQQAGSNVPNTTPAASTTVLPPEDVTVNIGGGYSSPEGGDQTLATPENPYPNTQYETPVESGYTAPASQAAQQYEYQPSADQTWAVPGLTKPTAGSNIGGGATSPELGDMSMYQRGETGKPTTSNYKYFETGTDLYGPGVYVQTEDPTKYYSDMDIDTQKGYTLYTTEDGSMYYQDASGNKYTIDSAGKVSIGGKDYNVRKGDESKKYYGIRTTGDLSDPDYEGKYKTFETEPSKVSEWQDIQNGQGWKYRYVDGEIYFAQPGDDVTKEGYTGLTNDEVQNWYTYQGKNYTNLNQQAYENEYGTYDPGTYVNKAWAKGADGNYYVPIFTGSDVMMERMLRPGEDSGDSSWLGSVGEVMKDVFNASPYALAAGLTMGAFSPVAATAGGVAGTAAEAAAPTFLGGITDALSSAGSYLAALPSTVATNLGNLTWSSLLPSSLSSVAVPAAVGGGLRGMQTGWDLEEVLKGAGYGAVGGYVGDKLLNLFKSPTASTGGTGSQGLSGDYGEIPQEFYDNKNLWKDYVGPQSTEDWWSIRGPNDVSALSGRYGEIPQEFYSDTGRWNNYVGPQSAEDWYSLVGPNDTGIVASGRYGEIPAEFYGNTGRWKDYNSVFQQAEDWYSNVGPNDTGIVASGRYGEIPQEFYSNTGRWKDYVGPQSIEDWYSTLGPNDTGIVARGNYGEIPQEFYDNTGRWRNYTGPQSAEEWWRDINPNDTVGQRMLTGRFGEIPKEFYDETGTWKNYVGPQSTEEWWSGINPNDADVWQLSGPPKEFYDPNGKWKDYIGPQSAEDWWSGMNPNDNYYWSIMQPPGGDWYIESSPGNWAIESSPGDWAIESSPGNWFIEAGQPGGWFIEPRTVTPWDKVKEVIGKIPDVLPYLTPFVTTGGTGATGGSSTSTQYPSGSSSGGAAYTTAEGSSGSATGSAGREAGLASLKKIAAIQALQDAINKKFSGPLYYT